MTMTPELLAPAGNLSKLKLAFYYGADAVYAGGKLFSLRTFADNFSEEELAEGIAYAHERGKKVYVAANIFARNGDLRGLETYFRRLFELRADAVLISDPGAFALCRRTAPSLPVHISTQANTMNAEAVRFWKEAGASRVVLARELSVGEIARIRDEVPGIELEAFVHGAMCVSYSGRCYLSDYLEGRSSNRGACAQPCRARYRIQAEGKEGWYEVEEDARGAYLMNSKDLNMSGHLDALRDAGVCSFKIEGRMKSEFYLATVVNAYRRILDGADPSALAAEFRAGTHRNYVTAYELGAGGAQSSSASQEKGECEFIALVKGYGAGRVRVEMRGRFFEGETLEILTPSAYFGKSVTVKEMRKDTGEPCADAKLVQGEYSFACPYPLSEGDILRRRTAQ